MERESWQPQSHLGFDTGSRHHTAWSCTRKLLPKDSSQDSQPLILPTCLRHGFIEYLESCYITVLCRAYDDESGRMQRTRRPVTQQLAYGVYVGTTPRKSQDYLSADRQYLAVDTTLCSPDKIRTISHHRMRRWHHVVLGRI
jgi:hypothetical protein